jgi:hypothetical protein
VLLPVAGIVYGSSLLRAGGAQNQLPVVVTDRHGTVDRVTRSAMSVSGSLMTFVGIAALTLGVLALVGVGARFTLTTVTMLAVGAALVIGGATAGIRFGRGIRHAA